jgi:long-chain acyl-CoA synthetase
MTVENRPWLRHYDPWVPTTFRYPMVAMQEFLKVAANLHPDKAATSFFGTEMTYRQLRLSAIRLANALAARGIGQGDRVALHLPNCPQYVIAYYAVLHLGAIVVNVNPLYTVNELKHVMELTQPKVFFTSDVSLAAVSALAKQVEPFTVVVTALKDFINGQKLSTAAGLDLPGGWLHFSELLEGSTSTMPPRVTIDPRDPAVIIFTGGTTGLPKGAVLSHANYSASATAISMWSESFNRQTPVERRSILSVIPLFHVYSQICCLHNAVTSLHTMILVPKFDIDELMHTLAGIPEISYFPTVPTLTHAIVNHPRATELDLGAKIKLINNGAAPMPLDLIHRVLDLGMFFIEGWGMTETTAMGTANPIVGLKKYGSIGIPFPGADIKLASLTGGDEAVPDGEPGEMLIKSPYVMQGYWNNPEETAGQLKDGWLSTGDVAVRDQDGFLFIVDRKKDMIIAGGFNIYPREIDEVLFQHPKVAEAISLGVPDEYRGETVKAFVVLKPGQSATAEEIVAFCKERLTGYKVPRLVEFRDSLPKSAVGKLLRKALRAEEIAKAKSKQ